MNLKTIALRAINTTLTANPIVIIAAGVMALALVVASAITVVL